MLTETVTTDHGCGSPPSMSPRPGSFEFGPGGAIPPRGGDTYGLSIPKSHVPSRLDPCTETFYQSLFIGGVYADSHIISFTMCGDGRSFSRII